MQPPSTHTVSYLENKPEYYDLLSFVELVAAEKRSDGTYNYCREALEQKAKELIKNIRIFKGTSL